METVLPTQFLPAVRLLRALQKKGSDRDMRLIDLALGHLELIHREHILSRAVGEDKLLELELAHRGDRASCPYQQQSGRTAGRFLEAGDHHVPRGRA